MLALPIVLLLGPPIRETWEMALHERPGFGDDKTIID